MPYRATRRVEFADTDMAGIMHFSRFFTLMEEVEHEWLRSRGLSVIMTWQGIKLGWPRVSAACEFYRPVFFEDLLAIELSIERLGTKSITFAAAFYRGDECVARGQITTCCCRVNGPGDMTAMDIPNEIRDQLQAICVHTG